MAIDRATLAGSIDQTLLKPTVGFKAAAEWIQNSAERGFASLCVSPFLVPVTSQILAGTGTKVCSVCGFPLGYSMTETKADEATQLVKLGCHEVDMVMNIAALIEAEDAFVKDDIAAVVEAVREASDGSAIVKVILETGFLDAEQIVRASRIAVTAGADFVKTSTGFGPRGASIEDVASMRATVGAGIGVKAAGGIRDLETALAMLEAGASRIGSSAGIEILEAFDARSGA
ncbi:MAG: deoxyribose-phosphate aldolase [Actinobacteria bacterium HGW-Actinobacteria-1]|jgi:deoxyribose-phosphate aldolase|nr:MAG: deoxyribose-phosphate aldolase [Actinobacteria bacterium HGW-Actinobacteria-1]